MQRLLLLLCLSLIGPVVLAQGAGTLSIDNDLFAPSGTDRDYTGGIRFTSRERDLRTWQAGLVLFTPAEIESNQPMTGERPYASLVYFGRSASISRTPDTLVRRTWTVGVLGSQLGEAAQRFVHEHTSSPEPRGYARQISDGGELTARFGYSHYKHIVSADTRAGHLSIVREVSGSVGYITDASYGIGFRLHQRGRNWWGSSRSDFLPQLDEPEMTDDFEGFFGGVRVRARAYNALLQGQFRHSDMTFAGSDLNRVLGEAWLGATTNVKDWHLKYTLRLTTTEVRRGSADRSHLWGAVVLSKRF
jgi:hypothetical protein